MGNQKSSSGFINYDYLVGNQTRGCNTKPCFTGSYEFEAIDGRQRANNVHV
jgi:hypothetical protein